MVNSKGILLMTRKNPSTGNKRRGKQADGTDNSCIMNSNIFEQKRKHMDIIIQSLGFKHSDNLEAFVHEKLAKLNNEAEKIVRANVTLYQGSGSNENNYCEIRLEVPGNDHFVKKSNEVFETAILEAVETLQKVFRKSKEKEISRRQAEMAPPTWFLKI